MIWDCFLFFDEVELLELRLNELWPVVDKFVLCESPLTFTGYSKALYYADQLSRFEDYREKIVPLVWAGPINLDPWQNETQQRNHLKVALKDANNRDLILLSDVDEIPHPKAIQVATWQLSKFKQRLFYYYVNNRHCQQSCYTTSTSMSNISSMRDLRLIRGRADVPTLKPEGWHFCYVGGRSRIQRKLEAFSEKVDPRLKTDQHLDRCLKDKADFLERPWVSMERVELDDSFPRCLPALIEKYPYLYDS